MPFCVNCGKEYDDAFRICRSCWRDPAVPHHRWQQLLERLRRGTDAHQQYPDFSYRREKLSLVVAILIAAILTIMFSAITLGLALLGILMSIIYMRIRWLQSRAAMMLVTKDNYSDIYSMAEIAAGRLRIPLPPIFLVQDPIPNAYTTGFFDENWVVIHSGLIELLGKEELLTVIGHEMGHIRYRHVTWLMMTSPTQIGHAPLIAALLSPIFNNWHHRSEYTADRAGLIASGELDCCLMTEFKLMSGKSLPESFDLQEYMKQIEQEEVSVPGRALELLMHTHPYARNRMRQMARFSESDTYRLIGTRFMCPDRAQSTHSE